MDDGERQLSTPRCAAASLLLGGCLGALSWRLAGAAHEGAPNPLVERIAASLIEGQSADQVFATWLIAGAAVTLWLATVGLWALCLACLVEAATTTRSRAGRSTVPTACHRPSILPVAWRPAVLAVLGVAALASTPATAVPPPQTAPQTASLTAPPSARLHVGTVGAADTTRTAGAAGIVEEGLGGIAELPGLDRPSGELRANPPRTRIVVRPGDTLWSIAQGLRPGDGVADVAALTDALYRANRALIGPDRDLIRPGQRLRLPALETDGRHQTRRPR